MPGGRQDTMKAEQTRPVGGMAIIEGVMMRGPRRWTAAIRTPSGTIETTGGPVPSWSDAVAHIPVVRGVATLAESLVLGVRVMAWSANRAAAGRPRQQLPTRPVRIGPTLGLGLLIATALFFVLPAMVARLVAADGSNFAPAETVMRLATFVAYLLAISQLSDVRRLFAYHGAEHMAVATHEAGEPLTVDAARRASRWHFRCGTTFLFVVVFISAGIGGLLGELDWAALAASRVLVLPLSAGLGYEVLRAAAAGRWPFPWLVAPGLGLQALTTRRPDDGQLEVALVALWGAIDEAVVEPAGDGPAVPVLVAVS